MSIELATVTTKRQFVIPRKSAERHHIAPGDILEFHDTAEGLLIKKHPMPVPLTRGKKYKIKINQAGFPVVSLGRPDTLTRERYREIMRGFP